MSTHLLTAGHLLAALVAVLLLASAGRAAARVLRQPPVLGEVAAGLLAVPVLAWAAGADAPGWLIPEPVLDGLRVVGEASLALFLVGTIAEMRRAEPGVSRSVGWITAGGLLPAAVAGLGVGWWVLTAASPAVRGPAPAVALLVYLAVAMSITAVPVLIRLVNDEGLAGTRSAALALRAAVVTDVICWIGLTVALGLHAGAATGWVGPTGGLAACVFAVPFGRRLLGTPKAERLAIRHPWTGAALVGLATLAAVAGAHHLGTTTLIASAVVALALPPSGPWAAAVLRVGRAGSALVPVLFVVAGVAAQAQPIGAIPWDLTATIVVLAVVCKIGGGWAGSTLGGESPRVSLAVGVLLNTRGLTELVVLQIGLTAGLLTPSLFVALTAMALITTVLTAPLMKLIRRRGKPTDAIHPGGLAR